MTKQKSTKRALLLSALSLLLCVSMLIGTTYAWFTDSVTSGNNKIVAGNLDVVLEYKNDWNDPWTVVEETTKVFDQNALYEPGYTEVVYLRVSNAGSLALKYKLMVDIASEKGSTNVLGDPFKLSEHLQIGSYVQDEYVGGFNYADILMPSMFGSRKSALSNVTLNKISEADSVVAVDRPVFADDESAQVLALVLTMPTTVGNEANYDATVAAAPEINLGVTLLATQFTEEEDSFDELYDQDANLDFTPVSNVNELKVALANKEPNIVFTKNIETAETLNVDYAANIDGNGFVLKRADGFTGTVFTVKANATLTTTDIVVDGGAVWSGPADPTLGRGITNSGVTATGNLIKTEGNGSIVLNEGTVLQNNVGAHAVYLDHGSKKGSLTLNGAQIMNNQSDSGAIWGGGAITVNEGSKINGNSSTGSAGAIRMVSSCNLTVNGGEINNNRAAGDGGVIWGYGASKYNFNGGEFAYNEAAGTGGVIYTGNYSAINIGGDFEMHDNKAANSGAIRLTDHTSINMVGGKVYNNTQNGESNAFNTWNNSISITGGEISDNFSYVGGLALTIGEAKIDGVIAYNLSTNHNTAYLAEKFNSFKFTVNEASANFAAFNFKPAAGYTYTEGDEAKLICMNEGYETYWDATTKTFRLKAK